MSVVLLGPASPWRGGIAHSNDLLTREIGRTTRIDVLTFTRQYPSWLFPGKDQKHPGESALDVGAEAWMDSVGPVSWWRTARRIRQLDPDLLVLRYWMPFFAPCLGTVTRRAVRNGRPEVVMVADNVVPHERRPFDAALTRYALAPVDRFVVMSDSVRADLLRLRPGVTVVVVPHPLFGQFGEAIPKSEARRRLRLDPHERVLLFFGFIRGYKGLDVLLDAMPAVLERLPVRLLVVGEFYEDEQPYRDQIARLGLTGQVELVADYVANDQVAPYFCAADAVTLPYRHATQSGIVPVAYQLDRPVICSDVGGLGEIVRHEESGFLVPPEDPRALAEAIVRFYEESWEERLVAGVRREKQRYTWQRFAAAVLGQTP